MLPKIDEKSDEDFTAKVIIETSYAIREHIDGMVALISPFEDTELQHGVP
jgi:hypothetical protein